MDDHRRRARGRAVRRAVLGAAHVDRAGSDPGAREFQDLLTRYVWGEIWTRPGLSRRTRSLLTVALLTAQGRSAELRLHVRGALRNGVTRKAIKEVLLHAAVYCGVPAAHAAFQVAAEVFAEERARPSRKRAVRKE